MLEIPVRVRDAIRSGAYHNNFKVIVLDENGDEDFVIDNNNLVEDSVSIDERMCSTDTLKFGLCEGTNLEFQYFGKPNITKRKIKLFIYVTYRDVDHTLQEYEIPLGWYDVKECSRQASTGIIKVSAYNKLLSDYLDTDVTETIKTIVSQGESGVSGSLSIAKALSILLENYSIETFTTGAVEIPTGYLGYATPSYEIALLDEYGATTGRYLCAMTTEGYFTPEIIDGEYYRVTVKGKNVLDYYQEQYYTSYLDDYVQVVEAVEDGEIIFTYKKIREIISTGVKPVEYQGTTINHDLIAMFGYMATIKGPNATTLYLDEQSTTANASSPNYTHIYNGTIDPNEQKFGVGAGFITWIKETNDPNYTPTLPESLDALQRFRLLPFERLITFEKINYSPMEKFRLTTSNISSITNGLTLRSLQSATFELLAQYGTLDRVTDLFSGVNLNGGRLYPSDTLFPADDLFPMSNSERITRATYSQFWADEGDIHKFKNLIVTYKNSTTNADATITAVINADGTDDYVMSDNWLLKNLSWTAAQVNAYISGMVEAMQGVTWFPFQLWAVGLPYLEAGDEIEVSVGGNIYTTYILTRSLSGIQNLKDTYTNGTLNIF